MQWEINGTDEFADRFESLTEAEQDQVPKAERLYEQYLKTLKQEGLLP